MRKRLSRTLGFAGRAGDQRRSSTFAVARFTHSSYSITRVERAAAVEFSLLNTPFGWHTAAY